MFLRANGVKSVNEKDLIMEFKAAAKQEAEKEIKPVTKEQRIKEASSFWNAFFAAHQTVNKDMK
jgi:hypothetical protein